MTPTRRTAQPMTEAERPARRAHQAKATRAVADRQARELRERWAAALTEWIAEGGPDHDRAPEDWQAAGQAARLMARTVRHYVVKLDGDLTDAEVRRDLRHVENFAALFLHAGDVLIAAHARAHGREPPPSAQAGRPRRMDPPEPPAEPEPPRRPRAKALTVAGVMEQARMWSESA